MQTDHAPRWVKDAHRLAYEGATPTQIARVLRRPRGQVKRVLGSTTVTLRTRDEILALQSQPTPKLTDPAAIHHRDLMLNLLGVGEGQPT